MLFFPRPSSTWTWSSPCQNTAPLPTRPAPITTSPFSPAFCNAPENLCRPRAQRFLSWEIVSNPPPPPLPPFPSRRPPTPDPSPPQKQQSCAIVPSDSPKTRLNPAHNSQLSSSYPSVGEILHTTTTIPTSTEPTAPFDLDTEAFPPYAHLFPSSPNGTWRNESLHALTHPTAVDYAALCAKLCVLAEEASDELSARVNRAFEGSDVPAMHDKVVGILPLVSMPDMRDLERAVEVGCEWGVGVLERRGRTASTRRRW